MEAGAAVAALLPSPCQNDERVVVVCTEVDIQDIWTCSIFTMF